MADLAGTGDVTIKNDDGTKIVSVITDGSVERLAVDSRDRPATYYQLKTSIGTTGTSVSTTDVTLYTYTGAGVIDFISVSDATSSAYEVAIFIDGTERFRISMSDLGTTLGLTNGDSVMWASTANKVFEYRPSAIGFTTSFALKARATTGTRTLYHMVLFREETT